MRLPRMRGDDPFFDLELVSENKFAPHARG